MIGEEAEMIETSVRRLPLDDSQRSGAAAPAKLTTRPGPGVPEGTPGHA